MQLDARDVPRAPIDPARCSRHCRVWSFFHSVHGFEWYLSLERWLPAPRPQRLKWPYGKALSPSQAIFGSQPGLLTNKEMVTTAECKQISQI
jgi:hypothetical protein